MSADDWDFEHQKAVTALTLRQIAEEGGPDGAVSVTLDLEFLPQENAETEACLKALTSFGYSVEAHEDGMIAASVDDVPLTLEAVWLHEERATRIALSRGYEPDGWGFMEP